MNTVMELRCPRCGARPTWMTWDISPPILNVRCAQGHGELSITRRQGDQTTAFLLEEVRFAWALMTSLVMDP